ncbi:hypothetical protein ACFSL6_12760 [Paenibacillus thailandensis]|uniref:DUF2140 family protein n=1 Tax=Paenibacillus thailandensis TaxID=393250 RepID=A0ABW5R0N2_9BACL
MSRTVRRLVAAFAVALVLAGGAALWLKSYVAPREALDLSYEGIDVKRKLLDMAARLEPMLILTEEDVNNLIKMELSKQGDAADSRIRIDGARFELQEGKLTAHLNVTYRNALPIGAVAVFRLSWEPPNIVLAPESVKVRDIRLPAGLADTRIIELPSEGIVRIKDVDFDRDRIKIGFAIPNIF